MIADLLDAFHRYLVSRNDNVLSGMLQGFRWDLQQRVLEPHRLAVVDYLGQCVNQDAPEERKLLSALSRAASGLRWAQTYSAADFGEAFLERYGWVELFGTRGHFESTDMAGGFLLLGPEVHYPDHHHIAEEIYIPLTDGSLWSRDGGAFQARQAGELIHHPSNIRHAMRTGSEPLIALYLWRGGPLAQKSIISGRQE